MAGKQKRNMNFTINVDIVTKANQQVNDYVKKLTELREKVGTRLSSSFIDDTIKSIKLGQKEMMGFSKEINKVGIDDKTRFAGINKTVSSYTKVMQQLRDADKVWINETTKNNAAVLKQLDDLLLKQKELSTLKGRQTYRKNRIAEQERFLQDSGYEGGTGVKDIQSLRSKVKNKEKELKENEAKGLLENKDLEAEIKLMNEWIAAIDIIIKQRKKLQDVNKELSGLSTYVGHKTTTNDPEEIQKRFNTEQTRLEGMSEDPKQLEETHTELQKLVSDHEQVGISGAEMNQTLIDAYNKSQAAAERVSETGETLKHIMARFGIGFSVAQIVDKLWDGVRAAYEFYKSLDNALNEIYIVSNLSSKAVAALKDDFLAMAEDTGMALDDVTRAATLFYQQGLYSNEVMEMTEVTAQFAKVAGIDATDAADKLTAAVNGYCLSAEDASLVADKFNKVAAASAADIDELSTAFSKAAAQANQAGVGMDNYLAYIATMVEATREAPENIGTSLKTIMSRMQQVKEAGTTEDGETDVNKVETALKSVGVQLRDTQGELRDLEDVLDELGGKWQSLDRNTQAYLGTIIAGTRQQSRFITLMQNWDRVLDLSEQSAQSAGQQALMHAKAMDSITSKTQQLQVALQEFISNIASSELFKGIISGLTSLIKLFNSGTGPIKLFMTAIILFRTQIGKTISSLAGWIKYQTRWISTLQKAGRISGDVKGIKKFGAALKGQTVFLKENDERIERLGNSINDLQNQYNAFLDKGPEESSGPKFDKWTEDAQKYESALTSMRQTQTNLRNANNELLQSYNSLGNVLMVLFVTFQSIEESADGFKKVLSFVAQLVVAGIAIYAAIKVINLQLVKTNGLLAIMKALIGDKSGLVMMAIAMAIMAVISLADKLVVSEKEMKEAISEAKEALEEFNNAKTAEKGAKSMLKDYEELANKVYRTAQEQERLNTLAQDLGDSLELEIIEDQFGNLSVSIDDVRDKIAALEYETEEARKEMIKTELDKIEELDNWGNRDRVKEFYTEYAKGNRATLRNVMGDIEYGIDTEDLATSADNVASIITNLKNSIIADTSEMANAFGGLGDNWTLTQQIESMAEAFNDTNIKSSDWNGLFRIFENLQGQIDEMTYDKTFNIVEAAVERWGEAAQLSEEQIRQMTDAVMTSLYGNDTIQKSIMKDEEALKKANGTYYTDKIHDAEQNRDFTTDKDQKKYYKNLAKQYKKEQQDYERFLWLEDEIKLYEDNGWQRMSAYNTYLEEYNKLKEHYNFLTKEEQATTQQRLELLKSLTGEERELYNNTGIFDAQNADLFEKMNADGVFKDINNALRDSGKNAGNQAFTEYLLDLIENTDDAEIRKQAQEVLEGVLDNITISGSITWTNLHETLDSISKDLRSINSIIQEFNDEGGITLDTFGEFAAIMDSLDIGAIFDVGELDNFLGALDNLKLGFDETTGLITANGDAMQSMQTIQIALTKAKIFSTKQQLMADRASLQSQIYTAEAEIAANQALIDYLAECGEETMKLEDIQAAGNVAYTKKMGEMVDAVGKYYFAMTEDSESWSTAAINNIAKVGEAVKQFINGDLDETNLKRYLNSLVGSENFEWQYTGSAAVVEGLEPDENGEYKISEVIAALKTHNDKGRNTIKELYARMKSLDNMIALLEDMEDADLSNLGLDPEELEKYIGELEEIFNLLRKIEGLQNRLNHLDKFLDMTYGKAHATFLQERINKSKELIGQQEELVKQQKYLEQTEQNAIKGSSVGHVFSFDEFGNIIIDYEKYLALQDEALEGQTSQRELADKLYEEYKEVHDTTVEYYDDLLDQIQDTIDAQQQLVDTYIDLEESVADSIKDTYQKMLDNKLEAIDTEIEALDKLRDARDRANQAKADSEELSDLQTDLKRAMMDSSGASNTKVLDYQEQIKQKLEDMGEDEYTRRLDSIQESLEDEKEQLQRNFDEYFEDWTAFHAMIKERVMGDEDAIMNVLKDSDDYKQAGEEKRREMEKEWSTQIADSVTELQNVGMNISEVQDSITSLQDAVIEKFDELLRNGEVSEVGTLLSRVLAELKIEQEEAAKEAAKKKAQEEANKKANNAGKTYDYDYEETIKYDKDKDKITQDEIDKEKDEMDEDAGAKFKVGSKVKSKNRKLLFGTTPSYTYNSETDTFKKTAGGYAGAFDDKVAEVKYKDGTWYYRMKSSDRNWWVKEEDLIPYKKGGMVDFTGPAWLDGTKTAPEAVLNAAQTKAFMKLVNHLDMFDTEGTMGNISIESIEFHVDSMSSIEDGEKAFDAFVNKFKEIGKQKGVSINTTRLK